MKKSVKLKMELIFEVIKIDLSVVSNIYILNSVNELR